MRIVSLAGEGAFRPGFQIGGEVVAAADVASVASWDDAAPDVLASGRRLIGLGLPRLRELERAAIAATEVLRSRRALVPLDEVRLGPPVPDPQKIVCLGLNYRDHAEEAGLEPPKAPMFFAKFANSLIGPHDTIVPPRTTEQVDYEAELAVVVGERGRDIPEDRALSHVAGAMAFNDVSARDLQLANGLWTGGKAIDTFAPCGPTLVSLDEVGELHALSLRTRVNGEVVQEGSTASMIFDVAATISFLSNIMTLEPGDIIATGTPAGVGMSRTPKLFLQGGDVVEVELEGVGTLRNPVAPAT